MMSASGVMQSGQPAAAADDFAKLSSMLKELSFLRGVSGILSWDEQVMMPTASDTSRGQQKAALAGVTHEKASSTTLRDAILACENHMGDLSSYQRAVVRDAKRDYENVSRVSKELSKKIAEAETAGVAAWTKARKENDWKSFAPYMRSGLDLAREYAQTTRPNMKPYDAAIDM